tara:strand:+ start:69 stop:305 length:237 start_codon:yes stop_codon:yes gene_type:complete
MEFKLNNNNQCLVTTHENHLEIVNSLLKNKYHFKVDTLLNYAYQNKYDDLITVSERYVRTGSIHTIKMEHVKSFFHEE